VRDRLTPQLVRIGAAELPIDLTIRFALNTMRSVNTAGGAVP
jgi:hypothetical protein